MATFEELMNQFRNPGETGIPETFADDLHKAYTDDLSVRDAAVKTRDQTIADKEKAFAEQAAEVLRLKAVNYDLISSVPKTGEPVDTDVTDPKNGSGIDSLFE
jgi:hypothetical protein